MLEKIKVNGFKQNRTEHFFSQVVNTTSEVLYTNQTINTYFKLVRAQLIWDNAVIIHNIFEPI